ncbi:hypothetical protein LCGC14_2003630 [marine sediment metagenome]|uniref:Uncharacterized protein n=1 Tax=marine sediment metagenome TaxID=412755 RepID=A0A0F9FQ62_9ZZZZ
MEYEWQEWVIGILGFILVVAIIIGFFILIAPLLSPDCPVGLHGECGDPPDSNAI